MQPKSTASTSPSAEPFSCPRTNAVFQRTDGINAPLRAPLSGGPPFLPIPVNAIAKHEMKYAKNNAPNDSYFMPHANKATNAVATNIRFKLNWFDGGVLAVVSGIPL